MIKRFKYWLSCRLLRYLYNAITEDDVLRVLKSGRMVVGNTVISEADRQAVIASARTVRDSVFWKYLVKDIKMVANRRIYESASNAEGLQYARSMLYNIDIIERKIANITKIK